YGPTGKKSAVFLPLSPFVKHTTPATSTGIMGMPRGCFFPSALTMQLPGENLCSFNPQIWRFEIKIILCFKNLPLKNNIL
ncbi:MAG: hypothetical protein WBY47_05325, partial [Desulfobacterales bacterium]